MIYELSRLEARKSSKIGMNYTLELNDVLSNQALSDFQKFFEERIDSFPDF